MYPKPLLISQFQNPEPPNPDRKDECHALRSGLRVSFRGELGECEHTRLHTDANSTPVRLSGNDDAKLWYGLWEYAMRVVCGLGYKFNDDPGWPYDIPFRDLNRIPGGKPVFKRIRSHWDGGLLRFVRATDEDKRMAQRDPRLVSPNAALRALALGIPRALPEPKQVAHRITDFASRFQLPAPPSSSTTGGVVLHPSTMLPQFTFSVLPMRAGAPDVAGKSDASTARRPQRSQRSDINKGRKRPVTNPEGRELRHPKRGPLTAKYVVEADGIAPDEVGQAIETKRIVLTDEDLSRCVDLGRQASGSGSGPSESDPDDMEDIESTDDWEAELRAERLRRGRV